MGIRVSAGLLLTALCIVYVPNVGHGFVKDDVSWIAHSDFSSTRDFLFGAPSGFYRPMVSLSFAVNRWACGTEEALCYGATNFLLLVAGAIVVFALGRALSMSDGAGLLAAALWAFNWNGINMAVLWISGRTALLLVLFATAGAVAFIKGRWFVAAVLMLAAMLSKEEAVCVPLALLAWYSIDRTATRAVTFRSALMFAAACALAEGLYFFLRFHSGAFTPETAPPYYRLSLSTSRLLANAPHYLDRAATFALAVAVVFWLVFRPRLTRLTSAHLGQIAFGLCWFIVGYSVTIFLPVRSSLYACLPSVGVAVIVASLTETLWRQLQPPAQRRAAVAGVAASFALLPLYYARNRPTVREAELSSRTLRTLQEVAAKRGTGTVVVLADDRTQKPSLDAAFGTLIQNAADLVVTPHIVVWIDPPPADAALAGSRPPERIDLRLVLRNGVLIPED
jgi:hypothetical protein